MVRKAKYDQLRVPKKGALKRGKTRALNGDRKYSLDYKRKKVRRQTSKAKLKGHRRKS